MNIRFKRASNYSKLLQCNSTDEAKEILKFTFQVLF